jgi:hypothetical protein
MLNHGMKGQTGHHRLIEDNTDLRIMVPPYQGIAGSLEPRLGSRSFHTTTSISPISKTAGRLRGQARASAAAGVIKIEQTPSDSDAHNKNVHRARAP